MKLLNVGGTLASGEELEFDIDTLPPRIARKLERFVNQKLASTNKFSVIFDIVEQRK